MLILIGGTGASQVMTAAAAPVLSRLYSPRDFGVYAIALAVFNLLSAVVCLRYETAIMLPRTRRSAANILALCLVVALLMSLVAVVICAVSWTVQFDGKQRGLEWWAALLVPLGVLFCGVQQAFRFWFMRHREFSTITQIVMTQTLVTLAVQITASALFFSSPAYLMLGTVLGFASSVVIALPKMSRMFPASLYSAVRPVRIACVAKQHRRFPLFATPYSFVSQAVGRLLLLILAFFVPTATIGEFALAQRVVYLPVSVLTSSMSQVFYSRAAHHLDDPKLRDFIRRIMIAGAFVFAPLVGFNFLFSTQIFTFAFGARWYEAGQFAAYLAIPSAVLALVVWLDRVYDIRSSQKLALLLETLGDSFSLGVLWLTMHFTRHALVGVASYCLAFSSYLLVWTYAAYRTAKFPTRDYGNVLEALGVAVVLAVASGMFVTSITSNLVLQSLVFIALNLPLVVLGMLIGRNGLQQRATILGAVRI